MQRKSKILTREDRSFFMPRNEPASRRRNAHLGRVFCDGPEPTGKRYGINAIALNLSNYEREVPDDPQFNSLKPAADSDLDWTELRGGIHLSKKGLGVRRNNGFLPSSP